MAAKTVGWEHEMKGANLWFCVSVGLLAVLQFSGGCSVKQVPEEQAGKCDAGRQEAETKKEVVKLPSTSDNEAEPEEQAPSEFKNLAPRPPAELWIEIVKQERKLRLYSGDTLLRVYSVSLGRHPVGDKVKAGDCRTPEGKFFICTKNPQSRFHLSLGLSYPAKEDAERGLKSGLITKSQHDAIVNRLAKKRTPLWNTPLGGEIFIHGGGAGWDWTIGCVAMSTKDVEELYAAVPLGTSVVIR